MNRSYEIQPIRSENLAAVATSYASVFAGEPWKEVSRCTQCGSFSSNEPGENAQCSCGGSFSKEAYPVKETAEYIAQEISQPDAVSAFLTQSLLLAKVQQTAQGFAWGYQMSRSHLSEKKYQTQEMQQLIVDVLSTCGFFFYVSEVGVLPELQGQGLGKLLTNQLLKEGEKKGYRHYVVRTNESSALRFILEKIGMKPVIGLQTGIRDTENEARVLFVGQR